MQILSSCINLILYDAIRFNVKAVVLERNLQWDSFFFTPYYMLTIYMLLSRDMEACQVKLCCLSTV